MSARTLSEARRAAIGRQHIGVAVFVERSRLARLKRVEPGPGGELNDAGAQGVGGLQARQAGSPVVEDPDDVAIAKRQEVAPNVLLDLDAESGVVGIAVLNVGGARALRFFQPLAPVPPEDGEDR